MIFSSFASRYHLYTLFVVLLRLLAPANSYATAPSHRLAQDQMVQETNCHTCNTFGIGALCQIKEFASLSEVMVNSLSTTRSPFQVDAYVRCQLQGRLEGDKLDRELEYLNNYRHYIKAASKAFGIPPQLLQCSILRETAFDDESSASHAAARGMCQITPITQRAIDQIVQDGQSLLSAKWDRAFDNLIAQGKYNFPNDAGESEPPSAFTTKGVHRSQNCIIASALYFRNMLEGLASLTGSSHSEDLVSRNSSDPNAYTNLLLVLGASYNAGPQAIKGIIKNVSPNFKLSAMVSKIESEASGETRRYVESLRRCLTPGDYRAPAGWYDENPLDGKKSMTTPECRDDLKAQDNELGLIPSEFWPGDQYFERTPEHRP